MEKRYQVFVSSTYEDLKEERKRIIETLLNAKFFLAGMELFTASNEEQFLYIKKIIDYCDYYVLILGARYGSIDKETGKSFTEMEYDYAIAQNIPVLAFVHSDPENVVANKREKNNIKLFNEFRSKVLKNSKMSKLWSENYELAADIIVSLFQMVDEHPRVGWVRGGENVEELLAQINRLRIENDKLARSNEELKDLLQDKKSADNLAQDEDIIKVTGIRYDNKDEYDPEFDMPVTIRINQKKRSCSLTWNALLQAVAPICFTGCKEYEFRNAINELCQEKIHEGNYDISQKSFDVIRFQMLALNWISIEKSYNDIEVDDICLTNEGKKEFMDKVTIKKHLQ